MPARAFAPVSTASLLLVLASAVAQQAAPPTGQSAGPQTLDTPRAFPSITSKQQWTQRAGEIREQVLVSCGLWPLPSKTPLQVHIFGKIERDGYSIEKVYFQTYPGFYLAGNLYRPLGHGQGPFPAILNPHGHWNQGRLTDVKDASIPARCINFARQGMLAFAYDMVGYNDTHFADAPTDASFDQLHHSFATDPADSLWNINLMGLQTWNSIRALDFLESLPDVDRHRLACTGASGGGTQTFILGAVDSRLAAQVPAVMVSHLMQGGCLCENAPGLRVEFSNMELAAAAAPRPQLLVASTGDWTKDTPRVEGPAIARIYQLLGAPQDFHYVQFDFGHNYNQTSREAVYAWFDHWLLHQPLCDSLPEPPYRMEPPADLRVFPDGKLPPDALTQAQFIQSLRRLHRVLWGNLLPSSRTGLKHFAQQVLPAWRHTLQLPDINAPARDKWLVRSPLSQTATSPFLSARLSLSCTPDTGEILATYWAPPTLLTQRSPRLVVLCPDTNETDGATTPTPDALAAALLSRGMAVLQIEKFRTAEPKDQFSNYFSTYNRTLLQERIRDLVRLCAAAPLVDPRPHLSFSVVLAGKGAAGVWCLLAAPAVNGVIADLANLDLSDEKTWLAPALFCPGVLNLGGVAGAAILAAPHPLCIGGATPADRATLSAAYAAAGASRRLQLPQRALSATEMAEWVKGNGL